MPFLTVATTPAPTIPLPPAAAITFMLGVIAALLGAVMYFLRRELKNNDEAHRQLRASIDETRRDLKADIGRVDARVGKVESTVEKLLAGQARIEGLLEGMSGVRAGAARQGESG